MTRGTACVLFCALALLPRPGIADDDEPRGDHVILRSGKILTGRVVGSTKVEKSKMLRVETDFGEIMVPQREVKKRNEMKKPRGEQVFRIRQIRVVHWKGKVERRPAGGGPWRGLGEGDRYTAKVESNAANALLAPGDSVRTGPRGSLDIIPHKDVWIRIAPNSEVEIPGGESGAQEEKPASLHLQRGQTLQRISGRPRDETFRIRTPSSVVDHVFVQGGKDSVFSLQTGTQDRLVVRAGAAQMEGVGTARAGETLQSGGKPAPARAEEIAALEVEPRGFPKDDLVYVRGGKFKVGGWPREIDADGVQGATSPRGCEEFEIRLSDFLIDRREVAAEEYHAFVVATDYRGDPALPPYEAPKPGEERWPAVHIDWDAAQAFARWCGKELPTEAQWEVAAHGGKDRPFPWGEEAGAAHLALDGGKWGEPLTIWVSVDADTVDVSMLGVRGLVSGPQEWCRDSWNESPFFKHLTALEKQEGMVVRGRKRNMRLRYPQQSSSRGEWAIGFRCVVEVK